MIEVMIKYENIVHVFKVPARIASDEFKQFLEKIYPSSEIKFYMIN